MSGLTRRRFVQSAAAAAPAAAGAAGSAAGGLASGARVSLNGTWRFRLDPGKGGESAGWHLPTAGGEGWSEVTVPHTWQVAQESHAHLGVAWYRREFDVPAQWAGSHVRVEFEAVYHSASVWLNGKPVGSHLRKGYTAFELDLTAGLKYGERNVLAVRADNSFDPAMLPRVDSYDWTPDGGITRPVNLLVTSPVFLQRIEVDAMPEPGEASAWIRVRAVIRNAGGLPAGVSIGWEAAEEASGRVVLRQPNAASVAVRPGATETISLPEAVLAEPRLWHFDQPNLYRLSARIEAAGKPVHELSDTFGIRRIEVKEGGLFLNGERVRLMGVERMAGSQPQFGMAEPAWWIEHDHNDMKELNCVFTRVHWQQDRRVLDYCDRHGILIQTEVPSWGTKTFEGMGDTPSHEILENGLEQLREMIGRDRNHPSIFAWGLCNEVNGQNPPAQKFIRAMAAEARKLDPQRLLTYASNSLQSNIGRDVAGELDLISWNEYYESWMQGDVPAMRRNLEEIHRVFPGKMVVISEYGLCECRPEHTGGDEKRIRVMREHTNVVRDYDWVGGAIFFCYNDYRTHIGDKGEGPLKQRVHGVVDLYGERKPSFEALRSESSPVAALTLSGTASSMTAVVTARGTLPAYTLRGYRLRWIVYGFGDLPMEQGEAPLPELAPGKSATLHFSAQEKAPRRIRVDVLRPTGFSALTALWKG
ncbi:MAG TPA: glycoside hydrolase family 2 TIM barrel-domain containing protein [Bryobacteraceae bacterium]|nr:glycoside hydrolase family 2 TIM barrel-domain containing protein [Bryobacteraceae bacterium]